MRLRNGMAMGEDDPAASRLAIVTWYGVKDIRVDARVEFSDSRTDFYGMPRMSIRYSYTAADRALIATMEKRCTQSGSSDRRAQDGPTLAVAGSSLHYQVTVRMGSSNAGNSVCDPSLGVWVCEVCMLVATA